MECEVWNRRSLLLNSPIEVYCCAVQESIATLQRLKRMAGFESQDFDPLVRSDPTVYTFESTYRCSYNFI